MQILLIGASGMVGQAALAACAADTRVRQVTAAEQPGGPRFTAAVETVGIHQLGRK